MKKNMAKPDYIKVSSFPKNEENPFLFKMIKSMPVRHRKKVVKGADGKSAMAIIQSETSDVIAQEAQFLRVEEVDEKQFIKVYVDFFSAQQGLTKAGREVLMYLLTLLEPKKDTIRVRIDLAMKYLDYKTQKPIFKGIADLLQSDVIARTSWNDEYYINPDLMFNGDRVVYAKAFIKKKIKKFEDETEAQYSLFDFKPNPSFETMRKEIDKNRRLDAVEKKNEALNHDLESGEILS